MFIQLLVDDLLVYNGTVNMASSPASSGRGNKASKHHTIQFTDSIEMAQRERHDVAWSAVFDVVIVLTAAVSNGANCRCSVSSKLLHRLARCY